MNRIARLGLATGALVVAGVAPAAAHVTVNPGSEPGGGYGELTFRVPTESDTASTTKIQIFLPADHPLAQLLVKPHPGWSYTVKNTKLTTPITNDDGDQVTEAASEIDWTANTPADAIKPGEYDDFEISTGAFPASGTMTFKALQTYSDGSVVRWIDASESDDHPAPVLTMTASADASASASPKPSSSSGSSSTAAAPAKESKTPLVLSIIALVVALVVALAGAGAGFVRRKS